MQDDLSKPDESSVPPRRVHSLNYWPADVHFEWPAVVPLMGGAMCGFIVNGGLTAMCVALVGPGGMMAGFATLWTLAIVVCSIGRDRNRQRTWRDWFIFGLLFGAGIEMLVGCVIVRK